jgi:hypothetical protein
MIDHPGLRIHFWIDRNLVSKLALNNFLELVKEREIPLKIKNVQNLRKSTITKKDKEFILSPLTSVYLRVDFCKLAISHHQLKKGKVNVSAFFDLDAKMPPLIIDKRTGGYLIDNGFVFAKSDNTYGFENGFHIFSRFKPGVVELMKEVAIDPALDLIKRDLSYRQDPQLIYKMLPILILESFIRHGVKSYLRQDLGRLSTHLDEDWKSRCITGINSRYGLNIISSSIHIDSRTGSGYDIRILCLPVKAIDLGSSHFS